MTYVTLIVRVLIFLALLGFAFMNSGVVTLRYWFSYEWTAPLVLILVIFLVIGIVIGLLAALGTIFRQRRQIQVLKKEIKLGAATTPAPAAASSPVADKPGS